MKLLPLIAACVLVATGFYCLPQYQLFSEAPKGELFRITPGQVTMRFGSTATAITSDGERWPKSIPSAQLTTSKPFILGFADGVKHNHGITVDP